MSGQSHTPSSGALDKQVRGMPERQKTPAESEFLGIDPAGKTPDEIEEEWPIPCLMRM